MKRSFRFAFVPVVTLAVGAPLVALVACSSDTTGGTTPTPSSTVAPNGDGGTGSTSSSSGGAATDTLMVSIADLYAPTSTPGPALDFVSRSISDTSQYTVIASNEPYGQVAGPFKVARIDGKAEVFAFPTGTYTAGSGAPVGYAADLVFSTAGVTDDAVVILADGDLVKPGKPEGTIPSGQGAIVFLVENQGEPAPTPGFVVDGACVTSTVPTGGDPVAYLPVGDHTITFVDEPMGTCNPTGSELTPITDISIVAGQATAVIQTGQRTPTDALVVIQDWHIGQ